MKSSKMNIELMKEYNKRSVLSTIRLSSPISRVEISRKLNLSRPSVSDIVSDLIKDDWVIEKEAVKVGKGRKPIYLEINPHGKYAFGVEISAFQANIIITNLKAEIIDSKSFNIHPSQQPTEVLNNISNTILEFKRTFESNDQNIMGIGVAMHGAVDPINGVSIFAPKLGWRNVLIKEFLEEKTNLVTIVDNDCNTSSLGELWFGNAQSKENYITVLVDYGIGAGIMSEGRLYRGVNHIAGQVGHITVDEDGPQCACGNYGCLETLASEPAILRQVQKRLKQGESSILSNRIIDELSIDDVYSSAKNGDSLCLNILATAGRYLGIGFSNLINLFNPSFLILGGGIIKVAEIIIPHIQEIITNRALGDAAKKTQVLTSQLGENLYPIGAATLIIDYSFNSN